MKIESIIRAISKDGDAIEHSEWVNFLSELSDQQVLEAYVAIRDQCMRLESEWRAGFVQAIGERASILPPIQHILEEGLINVIHGAIQSDIDAYCSYLVDDMMEEIDLDWIDAAGVSIRSLMSQIPEAYREGIALLNKNSSLH